MCSEIDVQIQAKYQTEPKYQQTQNRWNKLRVYWKIACGKWRLLNVKCISCSSVIYLHFFLFKTEEKKKKSLVEEGDCASPRCSRNDGYISSTWFYRAHTTPCTNVIRFHAKCALCAVHSCWHFTNAICQCYSIAGFSSCHCEIAHSFSIEWIALQNVIWMPATFSATIIIAVPFYENKFFLLCRHIT